MTVMPPAQAADIMFAGASRERRFWILTHPEQSAPAIRGAAPRASSPAGNPGDESVDPNFGDPRADAPSG